MARVRSGWAGDPSQSRLSCEIRWCYSELCPDSPCKHQVRRQHTLSVLLSAHPLPLLQRSRGESVPFHPPGHNCPRFAFCPSPLVLLQHAAVKALLHLLDHLLRHPGTLLLGPPLPQESAPFPPPLCGICCSLLMHHLHRGVQNWMHPQSRKRGQKGPKQGGVPRPFHASVWAFPHPGLQVSIVIAPSGCSKLSLSGCHRDQWCVCTQCITNATRSINIQPSLVQPVGTCPQPVSPVSSWVKPFNFQTAQLYLTDEHRLILILSP